VVAVAEHLALATPQLVERPGDPDQQALGAAGERFAVAGLGEEVDVVVQDRVVAEAERPGCRSRAAATGGERGAKRRLFGPPPQGPEAPAQLHGHMDRKPGRERCALAVAHARFLALRLAAGPGPPAPPALRERQQRCLWRARGSRAGGHID
jgi:hypothetical protein